jgi:hypothetical protein
LHQKADTILRQQTKGRNMTLAKLEYMYLDFVNNFLTIECFAEHYGLDYFDAEWIIEQGKALNAVMGQVNSMNECGILMIVKTA